MEGRMSWYHALLKAPKHPSASQALLWGYSCIAARGRLRPSHGLSALEARWIYWNTLKIVEYRGISWNAMKNHDVMVCLGSSLNILEYHADSPITPLGLASTTLGIFLYRRRGASAPEPPSPQKWEKGWPHQTTRGMSWNSAEYHDVTSGSVLEARCVY